MGHSHPSTAMRLLILVVLAFSAALATEDEASPGDEISRRLFQEADANSDGQLSLQEFLSIGEETSSGSRQGRTFPSGLLLRSKDSARRPTARKGSLMGSHAPSFRSAFYGSDDVCDMCYRYDCSYCYEC